MTIECKIKQNAILIEIIAETLIEKFGCFPTQAIFSHLEKKYALKKDEIPKKLDFFLKILKEMFGAHGGKALEKAFVEKMHERLAIGIKSSTFIECVKILRTYEI